MQRDTPSTSFARDRGEAARPKTLNRELTTAATPPVPRNNIVTINVEDYFQVGTFSQLIPFTSWERFDVRLRRNAEITLALLARFDATATFFASGWIGENYPEILRDIHRAGHEVACQGYYQQPIREIAPPAFRDDVRRSRQAIEDAIGETVQGFRIGRGRIGPNDLWALDVLASEGFSYDASLSPIGRQFSTEPGRFTLHQHESAHGSIWAVPVSATKLCGWAVPLSGGNYLRQLPVWLTREAAARWIERRDAPLVMYFHLWELDAEQPLINAANWVQRLRHYRNLADMPRRVATFLERYPFTSIRSYLDLRAAAIDRTFRTALPAHAPPTNMPTASAAPRLALTVVIPCYNEEASLAYLANTLDRFSAAAIERLDLNFVFVNDGSRDTTATKLDEIFGGRPDCAIVHHPVNRGIAAAIITGFAHATTDFVAVLDADCTFDPLQLVDMAAMLAPGIDVVGASPLHPDGNIGNVPHWRLLLSRGAAVLYRSVLHHQFTSYTSCFRLYRRAVVQDLRVYNQGFCGVAEIFARIDLAGGHMVECPVKLETRLLGQSKINLLKTIFDHLYLIARIAAARWLAMPLPDADARRAIHVD